MVGVNTEERAYDAGTKKIPIGARQSAAWPGARAQILAIRTPIGEADASQIHLKNVPLRTWTTGIVKSALVQVHFSTGEIEAGVREKAGQTEATWPRQAGTRAAGPACPQFWPQGRRLSGMPEIL